MIVRFRRLLHGRWRGWLIAVSERGVRVREVKLPALDHISDIHNAIFCTETTAKYRAHVPPGTALPLAANASFAYCITIGQGVYRVACNQRRVMTEQVGTVLRDCDVILSPTTPVMRALKDAISLTAVDREMDFIYALVRQTCPFNLSGHPTISLLVAGGSLQFVGRSSGAVFAVAETIFGDNG